MLFRAMLFLLTVMMLWYLLLEVICPNCFFWQSKLWDKSGSNPFSQATLFHCSNHSFLPAPSHPPKMVRLRWWRVSWTNPIMKHYFSFQWQEKNLASIGKSSSHECFEAELSFNLPLSWAELSKEVKVLFFIFNLAISGDKPQHLGLYPSMK